MKKRLLVFAVLPLMLVACPPTPAPAPAGTAPNTGDTPAASLVAGQAVNTYLKSLPAWLVFSPPPPSLGQVDISNLIDLPVYQSPIVLPVAPVVRTPINTNPINQQPGLSTRALGDIFKQPIAPVLRQAPIYKPTKKSWNTDFEGQNYDCNSTPYDITETPDKVVTLNPDVKALWPGSILQGQGYINGIGSLMELPVRERTPVKLNLSLAFAGNARTVNNPDLASVQQAVGEIIQDAKAKNVALGGAISFKQTTAHSAEQSLLEAGLSVRYIASSIKANLKVEKEIVENTTTATFFQNAFSVSMVTPQTPAEFFSSAFTPEKLDEQVKLGRIGPANVPVYVSTVNYGRVLIFNLTSRASKSEVQGALSAVYNGGLVSAGGSLSASQKKVLSEAKIGFVAFGGNQSAAEALIRSGNLASYFNDSTTADVYRPISYEVRNLGDDSIAKVSDTTSYNIRECKVRPPPAAAAPVFVKVGERIKITVNNLKILDDGEDGDGGQMIGNLFLNGRQIWEKSKTWPQQLQSGNFLTFPYASEERDFRTAVGGRFQIQGAIDDYDETFGNDLVGRYDIQIPYPMRFGTFTVRSDPDKDEGESELTYTIEKLNDIREEQK
jgi:Thiol-activated cytolysin